MIAFFDSWDIQEFLRSRKCDHVGMEGTREGRRVAMYMVAGAKRGRKYPCPRSTRWRDQERVEAAGGRNVPKVDLERSETILERLEHLSTRPKAGVEG
jgi:hypothetical protein